MFFRLTSPQGVVVLTSPWLGNRDAPISLDQIERADIILVPSSHNDDMGNPVEIAARTGGTVLAPAPLGRWLVENGLDQSQMVRAGVGDVRDIQGVRIRVLPNHHDNTIGASGADGGPAVAYMITFENGFTVYFSPHNLISMDMQLYGMLYQPHMLLLSLGSAPAALPDPVEFAHTVRLLATDNANLQVVMPQHLRPGHPSIGEVAVEMERLGLDGLLFEPSIGVVYRY
jgi:L-ascorbate metabolism protein UlaG (beta-lactamase superfamily)